MEQRRGGGFFRTLGKIVAGILIAALIALAVGALVMVLWNWLMTDIFDLRPISYWEGFGLVLLLRLLIGGFGEHHGSEGRMRRRYPRGHRYPRSYYGGRLDDMYEQWWESEGEERFDQYMKQQEKKEAPPEDKDKADE